MANIEATQHKKNAMDSLADGKRNSVETTECLEVGKKSSQDEDMKVYGHAERLTYTEEEHKQVLRKIDWILLPLLAACYMFSVSTGPLLG